MATRNTVELTSSMTAATRPGSPSRDGLPDSALRAPAGDHQEAEDDQADSHLGGRPAEAPRPDGHLDGWEMATTEGPQNEEQQGHRAEPGSKPDAHRPSAPRSDENVQAYAGKDRQGEDEDLEGRTHRTSPSPEGR